MRTIPKKSLGKNRSISAKCISWLSKILHSFLARAATFSSSNPEADLVTSHPALWRNSTTSIRTFSSMRKRISGSGESDIFLLLNHFRSKMKSSLNMLFGKFGIRLNNLLWRLPRLKHFQYKIDHNACSLKTRLAMTDFGVNCNIIFNSRNFLQHISTFPQSTIQPERAIVKHKFSIPSFRGDGNNRNANLDSRGRASINRRK